MSRVEGAALVLAAALACTPSAPDATATADDAGNTTAEGTDPASGSSRGTDMGPGPSTGDGATSDTGVETTSGLDMTTTAPTSGGGPGGADCGDGVAAPAELCLRRVDLALSLSADLLELGDLDGDGHLDLVGVQGFPCPILPASAIGPRARVLPEGGSCFGILGVALGDGDGGFLEASQLDVAASSAGLLVADVNGDENLDALLIGGGTNVLVFSGDGAGSFAEPMVHPLSFPAADLLAGDLDADGDLDLVGIGDAWISVLVGDGVGGFGVNPIAKAQGPWPVRGTLFALDEDDTLDMVFGAADVGGSAIEVWHGDGDGSFAHVQSVVVTGELVDLVVSDAAQDGRPTVLASVLQDTLVLRYFPVTPDGTLGEPGSVPGETQKQLVLGRFDGEDGPDLIRVGTDRLDVLFGGQPWPSEPVVRVDGFTAAPDGPRSGDLNEDGIDDVALSMTQVLLSDP